MSEISTYFAVIAARKHTSPDDSECKFFKESNDCLAQLGG